MANSSWKIIMTSDFNFAYDSIAVITGAHLWSDPNIRIRIRANGIWIMSS